MTVRATRLVAPLLVAVLAATVASCASDSLRERDARSVRVGQVLPTSYTAAVRGSQSHVMLPSGRADLTLTKPIREIAAQDAVGSAPLRPTGGAVAVGVSWSLNRGGFPNSVNRQLTAPKTIFGLPQPVRLWLVTDGTRREIPRAGTLEVPDSRPRNAAWVIVPAGVRQWYFDVDYGGVTQRVNARSGTVTPGRAAALYRPLPLDRRGSCTLGADDEYYTSCLLAYAIGYPYVDGAGWAPAGKVFALVRISVGSDLDGGEDVRVAGVRSTAQVSATAETFRAYPVTPASRYSLRGTGRAEDAGRTLTVPLTGTLSGEPVL